MIKIVSYKICPFVQRVTAALSVRNIPFEVQYIDLNNKPDWFLAISPHGQVPLMVLADQTVLFESDAIVEYINDEYGELFPLTNEQRVIERAWRYLATKNYLLQCSTMRSSDAATFKERAQKLMDVFKKVEQQLTNEQAYFHSQQLGEVDIAWLPLLHRAEIVRLHTGYDLLSGLTKTKRWQHNVLSQLIVEQTVADDFEYHFTQFYLTKTYLGGCEKTHMCHLKACC